MSPRSWTTAAWRLVSRPPCLRSSVASCRSASPRGTAAWPDRTTHRRSSSARRRRVRRLLWHPGELGAAQAYVTGELDVEGDLDAALTHVWNVAADRGLSGVRPGPALLANRCVWPRTSASSDRLRPRRTARPCSAAGCTAAARPPGDPPPLRPLQRVLRADPRPAHGVLVRVLAVGRRRVHRGGRAARQARAGLPQGRSRSSGDAVPRRRLRLGLAHPVCGGALRSAGHRRHHRAGAEAVHRRAHPRARSGGPGRDPAAGLPRDHRRPVRRGRLPRDGRARRPAQLRHLRESVLRDNVFPGGRVLIQQMSRTGPVPRRRSVHRVVHRPGHAHASGRRDRRAHRVRRPRGPGRPRPAGALRAYRRRVVSHLRGQLGPCGRPRGRGGRPACGGSTSSAVRWRSATVGWASTRSSRSDRGGAPSMPPVRSW